ncbi:MauE/DoxX family redox-associated membrane protein [Salinispora vitiensis]|uniref:MauE/DoxX family redox-associated membrane protein n=1 Tax=Salinispora vitiensis TaxID=999544 RepID=UPI0037CC25E7
MLYVELACRLSLAGVLLLASFAKARTLSESRYMVAVVLKDVLRFQSQYLARSGIFLVIVAEGGSGILLVIPGPLIPFGYLAAIVMLGIFTGLAVVSVRKGDKIPCACFGGNVTALSLRHVSRNTSLLALGIAGLLMHFQLAYQSLALAGIVISVGVACLITLLAVHFDDIVEIFVDG